MLVNNQPNKAVACRADISLCCSVAILDDDIDIGLKASQKWLQAEGKDDEPKKEKGEQREKYVFAQSLFVWRTRTMDRRGIWLVVLVTFWLLLAESKPPFFRSFRAENLQIIYALLEFFDGNHDAKIMKSFKNENAQGKTQREKGCGASYF